MTTSPTSTPAEKPAKPKFFDRVAFAPLYAGLHTQGIDLTDEEKVRLKAIIEQNARKYEGGAAIGNDIGGFFEKIVYMFVYFLESLGQNKDSANKDNFVDWFKKRTGETTDAAEFKMLQDCAASINLDMRDAGGNLARAADIVTGVSSSGTTPKDVTWSVYRQIRKDIADPVNPLSTSLNLNYAQADNGAAVRPASTPKVPTPALTGPTRSA